MIIDWDVPIPMADGTVLRADVFRPDGGVRHAVIMTLGPYAKGLAFQEGYAAMWDNLVREHPDAVAGSTNRYLNWETVDPEKWVPDGYAVVRVDSRGAGNSPGYLDIFSPQETRDYYECIEWAGTQAWSAGHQVTGALIAGQERLSDEELLANRAPTVQELREHPLLDDYYAQRTADLPRIEVPVLSATNWAHHLHTRGGFEGYLGVSSQQKWLEVHGLQHWVEFYTDYGVALQKRFFGHFLKGEDTGWDSQPPVALRVRRVDGSFADRTAAAWPLPGTRWTELYLDIDQRKLTPRPAAGGQQEWFEATGDGLTFWTDPFDRETELTGPAAASLTVSSTTNEADLFLTLRVQDPAGNDVTFPAAMDPQGGIGFGWLRSSLRKTDPGRSQPYRPWHTFDEHQPLQPGEPVDVDVEIWPFSVIIPKGYRLGVSILGRDFEFPGDGPWPAAYGVSMRGNGIFVHTDEHDRGGPEFRGTTTLYTGGGRGKLLLPLLDPAA